MIPKVGAELGCYHCVYISIHFIKQDEVEKMQQQVGVDPDPDGGQIEDVVLDDEIKRHWRMVFEDTNRGVDRKEELLHAKNWDVYNLERKALVKVGY